MSWWLWLVVAWYGAAVLGGLTLAAFHLLDLARAIERPGRQSSELVRVSG